MRAVTTCVCLVVMVSDGHTPAAAHEPGSAGGAHRDRPLPSRYPYVVKDVLKFCRPNKGFWIDLGAGKGQVAAALIEATGNPVVMLDPDEEAMVRGLEIARQKGLGDRLMAVVGVAEDMPFPDGCVDLVVSRGSIFFWDDPVKGLQEVYRVLRPGGKAYIGGGAGSGYPPHAVQRLIEQRKKRLQGDEARKWKRFVELRSPEQMRSWAASAGLAEYEVMGKGAISAEDARVGQGVWLLFEKQPHAPIQKSEDRGTVQNEDRAGICSIHSPNGVGVATLCRQLGRGDAVDAAGVRAIGLIRPSATALRRRGVGLRLLAAADCRAASDSGRSTFAPRRRIPGCTAS